MKMVIPQAKREPRRDGRYKGVRMRKWGRWVAEVRQRSSRDRIWLGSYDTAEMAARAYDAAVFCLRGQSAVLNFPNDPPFIPSAEKLSPSDIQVEASKHARKTVDEAQVLAAGDLKQPLSVGNVISGEPPELGSSSFVECQGGEGHVATDGGGRCGGSVGGADDVGVFYDASPVWNI
ncbi:hypothetical protein OROGR_017891 [Orobanche gracilis]